MNTNNNNQTILRRDKNAPNRMNNGNNIKNKCKFCGDEDGATLVAILRKEAGSDGELDPKKVLWLCDTHYRKIVETKEYRVRELPDEEVELGHSSREEVEDSGREYVTILEPKNENKWLKVPDFLEKDLKEHE